MERICIVEDWVIDKRFWQEDMIIRNFGRLRLSVIILSLSCASFASAYSGGTGEPNNPYKIANITDFNQLTLDPNNWNKSFILTADINLAGLTFTQAPIAPDINSITSGFQGTMFNGSFDGNGHIIRNLTYTTTTAGNYAGLFGYTSNAAIKNLGLEDVNIYTAGGRIGGLVGQQDYGTFTSCYSTSSVISTANSSAINGGLVGWQFCGSIDSSYSTGNIAATSAVSTAYAGGLVGSQSYGAGPIASCYSTGNVVSTTNGPSSYGSGVDVFAGGLVAAYSGSIKSCYSTGQASATGNHFVYKGGLLGYKSTGGIVTACFWDINTSGLNTSAGGTGETTAQMKTLSTFTSAGWDFTNETANDINDYWRMCVNGVNYPHLNWESIAGDLACPDGVNFVDFAYFADRWLESDCTSSNNFCGGADMDSSGTVDMQDIDIFAANWLTGE